MMVRLHLYSISVNFKHGDKMNTIFIYDQCGTEQIQFFVLDGDYSHLNDFYINSSDGDDLFDELIAIIDINTDNMVTVFPLEYVNQESKVIVVGFVP